MKLIGYTACVLVVALTAGCGTSGSDAGPAPEIDPSRLRPGNYRTAPRTAEEIRRPINIEILESVRLKSILPEIYDIDPKLVFAHLSSAKAMYTPQHPPTEYDEGVGAKDFAVAVPGLIAGAAASGQRRESSPLGRNATIKLLRFANASQAAHAADLLAAEARDDLKGPVEIPGYPAARAAVSKFDSVMSWVPHGEFMTYTYVGMGVDIPPDHRPLIDLTKRLLDKQVENLAGFRPTPLDRVAELPVDIDGLLTYALPPTDDVIPESVVTAQVARQMVDRPDLARRAFEDARVDLVVRGGPTIYRTADSAAATRLQAHFVSQVDPEYHPVDPPPGFPTANCVQNSSFTSWLECIFTSGRYTVTLEGQQLQDLHQQVSAQYLLLQHAE
ncbi:hypothetical protein [Nocardia sp. NPDC019395]|uniref:DUF7373 family lipoprotein n=1 Tax=Nocardia sp. NPDC019395 TaxID=3154686 RepID=UPI00340469AB